MRLGAWPASTVCHLTYKARSRDLSVKPTNDAGRSKQDGGSRLVTARVLVSTTTALKTNRGFPGRRETPTLNLPNTDRVNSVTCVTIYESTVRTKCASSSTPGASVVYIFGLPPPFLSRVVPAASPHRAGWGVTGSALCYCWPTERLHRSSTVTVPPVEPGVSTASQGYCGPPLLPLPSPGVPWSYISPPHTHTHKVGEKRPLVHVLLTLGFKIKTTIII